MNEHTICVVGGWDGKKRSTDVWIFDVDTNEWKILDSDPCCSLPAGKKFFEEKLILGSCIISSKKNYETACKHSAIS